MWEKDGNQGVKLFKIITDKRLKLIPLEVIFELYSDSGYKNK